jgi:hypothetical protein
MSPPARTKVVSRSASVTADRASSARASPDLRALLPGRPVDDATRRRHRHGPLHLPPRGGAFGWPHMARALRPGRVGVRRLAAARSAARARGRGACVRSGSGLSGVASRHGSGGRAGTSAARQTPRRRVDVWGRRRRRRQPPTRSRAEAAHARFLGTLSPRARGAVRSRWCRRRGRVLGVPPRRDPLRVRASSAACAPLDRSGPYPPWGPPEFVGPVRRS